MWYGAWQGNGAEVKITAKTGKVLTVTECSGGADWEFWMDGISDVRCRDGG